MDAELLKLENQVCHRVYAVTNALTRRYRPHLEAINLTYPQYIVMMALWEQDKIPIQELTLKTKMDAGSISLILKKLEQKSFINIKVETEDRRKRNIVLTSNGRKLQKKALVVPEEMGCHLHSVSAKDIERVKDILDRLYADFSS